jgi:hypothetical protein
VGKSKTEAGTGRVIPLNDTAIAALGAHAASYTRRFGECRPEWFVFAFGTPLLARGVRCEVAAEAQFVTPLVQPLINLKTAVGRAP